MNSRISISFWFHVAAATLALSGISNAVEPIVAPGNTAGNATGLPRNQLPSNFAIPNDAAAATNAAVAPNSGASTRTLPTNTASDVAAGSVVEGSSLQNVPSGVVDAHGYTHHEYATSHGHHGGGGYTIPVGPELAKVQFYMDLLILSRDDAEDSDLLFDSVTGDPLLSVGDLTSGAHTGIRIGAIFYDEGGRDLEFSVISMDDFGEPVTQDNDNPILFPFFGGIPADPQTTYTVDYSSKFASGEINVRQRYGSRVAWLAGFRYAELNERFNVISGNGQFASDVDNDLYGFQIGGEVCLGMIRRSILFASLKGGAYYNNADVSATATSGSTLVNFIDDEDEFAFLGDVSVGILIPMGPQADLRLGYQGLFLDGVGLAPDQSDNFSLFTSSGTLDTGTLMYHGGFIGFDIFW